MIAGDLADIVKLANIIVSLLHCLPFSKVTESVGRTEAAIFINVASLVFYLIAYNGVYCVQLYHQKG